MKFEMKFTVTQEEVHEFLTEKGLRGTWLEPTIFELKEYTGEEFDMAHKLCQTGFEVKGVKVTARVLIPPPPQLRYVRNVI